MKSLGERILSLWKWTAVGLAAALGAALLLATGCSSGGQSSGSQPNAATLQAINITPTTEFLPLGGTRQLIALGTYSDGSVEDLSSQVTWSVATIEDSSGGSGSNSSNGSSNPTNFISINSTGMVTGLGLGTNNITATLGNIVGVLSLVVESNGLSSTTVSTLVVPTNLTTFVDAAYVPRSIARQNGTYTVQVINLDADQSSKVLPPNSAWIATVPMPAGYVPNATAADQSTMQVAVISYTSPDVQIIDASNLTSDATSNMVIATFKAPVSKSVTFNGKTCIICAAVVNPLDHQLILSTAQGYYAMDMNKGTFAALTFSPPAYPAESFVLNPVATDPYIVSPNFGQDPANPAEVQILDLTQKTSTTNTSLGLVQPLDPVIDLLSGAAAVTDAAADSESMLDLTNPQSPASVLASGIKFCSGAGTTQAPLSMGALGVKASGGPSSVFPTLFLSQPSGGCVAFEIWPEGGTAALDLSSVNYGYGLMPAKPDGNAFANGSDPNTIGTFTSVVDKKNYGFLMDATQNYIAKINFATMESEFSNGTFSLPSLGFSMPSGVVPFLADQAGGGIIYLQAYLTSGTVSVAADSATVNWVAGNKFTTGSAWDNATITIGGFFPGCLGGTTYTVNNVNSATQLTLLNAYGGPSGQMPYCLP